MSAENKSLDQLQPDDGVRYQQRDWVVTARDVYKESSDYREVQWTLVDDDKQTLYLVCSQEKKESGAEYVWVLTKEIDLSLIKYQPANNPSFDFSPSIPLNLATDLTSPGLPGGTRSLTPAAPAVGGWQVLLENSMPTVAPTVLKLDNCIFSFRGETLGKARDDEGDMIPKITWEYYDDSGKRNLAVEIWQEDGENYPEAYSGNVVDPRDFVVTPADVSRKVLQSSIRVLQKLGKTVVISLVVAFLLWSCGVPLDYLIAASVPFFCVVALFQTSSLFLTAVAGLNWIFLGFLLFVLNAYASFAVVTAAAMILSLSIPKVVAALAPDNKEPLTPLLFLANLLPALWVYSFFVYFVYAPGPHNGGQLLVTCVLPVAATGLCLWANCLVNRNG